MRSSLTRNVFRAIIANEPYCITTCSKRLHRWRGRPLNLPTSSSTYRRPLFGFPSRSATRTVLENQSTPANVEKASNVLVGLVRAQRDQTQLPPVEQIAQAFSIVLSYRNQHPVPLSRSDVYLLTEGFKFIQDHEG